jgi:hypothetical protein
MIIDRLPRNDEMPAVFQRHRLIDAASGNGKHNRSNVFRHHSGKAVIRRYRDGELIE